MNCDPNWPICLFDFTQKNSSNEYQAMRIKSKISDYIVEDHFYTKHSMGYEMAKKKRPTNDQCDVIREYTCHLC